VRKVVIAAAVAVVAVLIVTTVFYRPSFISPEKGRPVQVVILPGWSGMRIASELEDRGVINSALLFRLLLRIQGQGANLKAGEYELRRGMAFREVLAELEEGPEVKYTTLTIPEGFTLDQIAQRIDEKTHLAAEEFRAAATLETVRPSIAPADAQSLEGFLYPETYFVTEKEGPQDVVRRLVGEFEEKTGEVPWDLASSYNISPYQALIIASMIEKEAKVPEERGLVAAVIYNRLRKGMKLEIDATVRYAVKKDQGEPLTPSDLEFNSPYNTRRFPNLPPGPIASPHTRSIVAALKPAASDALYFVLGADCKHHLFTADYDEFLRAKEQQPSC
jgi:UPF0755 protein